MRNDMLYTGADTVHQVLADVGTTIPLEGR